MRSGNLERRGESSGVYYRLVEQPKQEQESPTPTPSTATTTGELIVEFDREMKSLAQRAQSEARYSASVYIRMLAEHGGIGTAKRLLRKGAPGYGFTELWKRGRLDLTVEALAMKPRFTSLFTEEELAMAARRLADYA